MKSHAFAAFAAILLLAGAGCSRPADSGAKEEPLIQVEVDGSPDGLQIEVVPAGEDPKGRPPVATPEPEKDPKPTPDPAPRGHSYTMAEVAAHADASSCWSAINGGVYNLTAWIDRHPGGSDFIKGICGKDGSAAFNGQHGDSGRAAGALAGFKLGTLKP